MESDCNRVQGTTMYCKVLGFTGVYWGEGVLVQKPNRKYISRICVECSFSLLDENTPQKYVTEIYSLNYKNLE